MILLTNLPAEVLAASIVTAVLHQLFLFWVFGLMGAVLVACLICFTAERFYNWLNQSRL